MSNRRPNTTSCFPTKLDPLDWLYRIDCSSHQSRLRGPLEGMLNSGAIAKKPTTSKNLCPKLKTQNLWHIQYHCRGPKENTWKTHHRLVSTNILRALNTLVSKRLKQNVDVHIPRAYLWMCAKCTFKHGVILQSDIGRRSCTYKVWKRPNHHILPLQPIDSLLIS